MATYDLGAAGDCPRPRSVCRRAHVECIAIVRTRYCVFEQNMVNYLSSKAKEERHGQNSESLRTN